MKRTGWAAENFFLDDVRRTEHIRYESKFSRTFSSRITNNSFVINSNEEILYNGYLPVDKTTDEDDDDAFFLSEVKSSKRKTREENSILQIDRWCEHFLLSSLSDRSIVHFSFFQRFEHSMDHGLSMLITWTNLTYSTNRMRIVQSQNASPFRYNPMKEVSGEITEKENVFIFFFSSFNQNSNQSYHYDRHHHQFYHVDHRDISISVGFFSLDFSKRFLLLLLVEVRVDIVNKCHFARKFFVKTMNWARVEVVWA